MQPLYGFDEFLLEKSAEEYKDYFKKVIFIGTVNTMVNINGQIENDREKINQKAFDDLFIPFSIVNDADKNLDIPQDMPILFYGGYKDNAKDFIKKFNIKEENLYNKPKEMTVSSLKVEFAKAFGKYDWLPKTVFSLNDAYKKLKFPVIAKIQDGHSGKGIKIFKTEEELKNFEQPFYVEDKKEKRNFDLYSECIDIDREFRIIVFKDRPLIFNERIPIIKENKTVKTKDINEGVKFAYVILDQNKIPNEFISKLKTIVQNIREVFKLDVWALDVVLDKENNMYVLETNNVPGLNAEKFVNLYQAIYEDYYKDKIPSQVIDIFNEKYINPHRKQTREKLEEEIKKSPWAIKYPK